MAGDGIHLIQRLTLQQLMQGAQFAFDRNTVFRQVIMILATGNTKATFVYDPTKNPVRLDYSPDGSVAYAGNKE